MVKTVRLVLAAHVARLMAERAALDTQVKLAKRAGLSQSTVGRVLRGDVYAGTDVVQALALAFRVRPGSLLDEGAADPAVVAAGADADRLRRWHRLGAADQARIDRFVDFILHESQG